MACGRDRRPCGPAGLTVHAARCWTARGGCRARSWWWGSSCWSVGCPGPCAGPLRCSRCCSSAPCWSALHSSSPATRPAGASCRVRPPCPAFASWPPRAATTPCATVPPAGPDEGLLLLIVAGIGLAALVVDTLGAGLDLPGMTLLPMAALFAVPWLVNRGSAPWWAFPLVALGWLALVSALQRARTWRWSPGARGQFSGDRIGDRGGDHRPGPARRWPDDPAWPRRARRDRHRLRWRDRRGGCAGLAAPIAGQQRHPSRSHTRHHRCAARLPAPVGPRTVRRGAVAARGTERDRALGTRTPRRQHPHQPGAAPGPAGGVPAGCRPAGWHRRAEPERLVPVADRLAGGVGPAHLVAAARRRGDHRGGPDRTRGHRPGPGRRRPARGQHRPSPSPSRSSARTWPTPRRSPARSCPSWPGTSRRTPQRPSTRQLPCSAGSPRTVASPTPPRSTAAPTRTPWRRS